MSLELLEPYFKKTLKIFHFKQAVWVYLVRARWLRGHPRSSQPTGPTLSVEKLLTSLSKLVATALKVSASYFADWLTAGRDFVSSTFIVNRHRRLCTHIESICHQGCLSAAVGGKWMPTTNLSGLWTRPTLTLVESRMEKILWRSDAETSPSVAWFFDSVQCDVDLVGVHPPTWVTTWRLAKPSTWLNWLNTQGSCTRINVV